MPRFRRGDPPGTPSPWSHEFNQARSGCTRSRQSLTLPLLAGTGSLAAELLPQLGPLYFRRLERITLGLIRVAASPSAIRFRLGGSPLALLTFAPPSCAGDEVCYPLVGGLMHLGGALDGILALGAAQDAAGLHLWMEVRDYYPRLPGWLYRYTQAPLHHWIARDYLRCVARHARANCSALGLSG